MGTQAGERRAGRAFSLGGGAVGPGGRRVGAGRGGRSVRRRARPRGDLQLDQRVHAAGGGQRSDRQRDAQLNGRGPCDRLSAAAAGARASTSTKAGAGGAAFVAAMVAERVSWRGGGAGEGPAAEGGGDIVPPMTRLAVLRSPRPRRPQITAHAGSSATRKLPGPPARDWSAV
jgi:hypothetical protein